jgi:hypothetical protein
VALCDLKGLDNQGSPSIARVVGQWTFDAYGEVLSAEHLFAFSRPRLGHKGLFLDRLDGSAAGPRLVPFGHGLYHMRNRAYAPGLGRFLQRDPNQTAMALAESAAMHGRGLGSLALAFDLEGLYGDGGNLYEYLGSNPWQRHDTLGLSWDPFDMVDDYLAESSGERAAFMERIVSAAQTAAYIGAVIASTLPLPLPVGILADIGADALEGQVSPELMKMRKLLGLVSLTALTATVGKLSFSAIKTSVHYVIKHGMRGTVRNLWNSTIGLARRGKDWIEHKWRKFTKVYKCGCFVGATVVLTPTGFVQISDLHEGDAVLAAQESADGLAPDIAPIEREIFVPEASTLKVTLRHGDGEIEVIHTTDEHPFHVEATREWVRADALVCGDQISALAGPATILALSFDLERVPVYNLSIPDAPTYYVGEHGVWTHNCSTFNAVRDYWGPLYGWKAPPRAEVRLLNLNTGERVVKIVSKDVHHREGRFWGGTNDLDNLEELWPWEHARIDPDRNRSFPYELLDVVQFIPPKW